MLDEALLQKVIAYALQVINEVSQELCAQYLGSTHV